MSITELRKLPASEKLKIIEPDSNAIRNSAAVYVPEGHHENSPAFQRWVDGNKFSSPEGTNRDQRRKFNRPPDRPFRDSPYGLLPTQR